MCNVERTATALDTNSNMPTVGADITLAPFIFTVAPTTGALPTSACALAAPTNSTAIVVAIISAITPACGM